MRSCSKGESPQLAMKLSARRVNELEICFVPELGDSRLIQFRSGPPTTAGNKRSADVRWSNHRRKIIPPRQRRGKLIHRDGVEVCPIPCGSTCLPCYPFQDESRLVM